MFESMLDNLKETIKENGLLHEIMIWGCCKNDEIISMLNKWGYSIRGYIDRNYISIGEYNGYPVYSPEKLKVKKYFVYVALKSNHSDVINILKSWGYCEFVDYWYPGRLVDLDGTEDYQDKYGNRLITENNTPVIVRLRNGGKVEIYAKNLNKTAKITSEGNSNVIIGQNVVFGDKMKVLSTNGNILIGNKCIFDDFIQIRASSGGTSQLGITVLFSDAAFWRHLSEPDLYWGRIVWCHILFS